MDILNISVFLGILIINEYIELKQSEISSVIIMMKEITRVASLGNL